jgi:cyclophilin family peptidyl-prolyl cis-trans isomerase
MRRLLASLPLILLCGCASTLPQIDEQNGDAKPNAPVKQGPPVVEIQTNMGNIDIELFEKSAPKTVKNFLAYVDQKHYNGTIFHRVIKNFMIQGGGFTIKLKRKHCMPPIKNEATNGLSNLRGTIAMARTQVVDSATNQFFINLKNNQFLNHKDYSAQRFGYCVFGKVIKGMDIVDKIAATKTINRRGFQNLPAELISIKQIIRKQ